MQKIQVTTAQINANAQVILPNTYFVTKAVKAMLAVDNFSDYMEDRKRHGDNIDPIVLDVMDKAGNFLHELIDALEGNEKSSHEQD